MDKLFLSKRMFIDNEFVNGGILVTPNGKIRSILRTQQEINSWMYANESDEVCLLWSSCLINNYLKCLNMLSIATSWISDKTVVLLYYAKIFSHNGLLKLKSLLCQRLIMYILVDFSTCYFSMISELSICNLQLAAYTENFMKSDIQFNWSNTLLI